MSSKADDFDVRYRDVGTAGHDRPAADGGYRGNAGAGISTTTWAMTRRAGTPKGSAARRRTSSTAMSPARPASSAGVPEATLPESIRSTGNGSTGNGGGVGTAVRPDHGRAPRGRRDGSHARAAGTRQVGARPAGTEETSQLGWESEATGRLFAPELPGRRSRGGGPGGPAGPGGPRRPRGPRGFGGPGRRGLDRTRVKVKGSWWRHWTWRKALGVLLARVGAFIVLGAIAVVMIYEQTPVPTAAMAATSFSQSVVYSSNGTLIGRFGTTNRQMLTYASFSNPSPSSTRCSPPRTGTSSTRAASRPRASCGPPTKTSGAATARCRAARPSPRSSSGSTTPASAPSRRSAARSRRSSWP